MREREKKGLGYLCGYVLILGESEQYNSHKLKREIILEFRFYVNFPDNFISVIVN